jgi:stringent starvation protein B
MDVQIQLDVKKLVTDAFASSYTLLSDQGHRVHVWYRPKTNAGFLERHKNKEGVITLNLTPESVHNLGISDNYLSFQARFNGKAENLLIALDEIEAIIDVDAGAAIPYPFTSFFIQLTQAMIAEKAGGVKLNVPVCANESVDVTTTDSEEQQLKEPEVSEETMIRRGWSPRLIIGGKSDD